MRTLTPTAARHRTIRLRRNIMASGCPRRKIPNSDSRCVGALHFAPLWVPAAPSLWLKSQTKNVLVFGWVLMPTSATGDRRRGSDSAVALAVVDPAIFIGAGIAFGQSAPACLPLVRIAVAITIGAIAGDGLARPGENLRCADCQHGGCDGKCERSFDKRFHEFPSIAHSGWVRAHEARFRGLDHSTSS